MWRADQLLSIPGLVKRTVLKASHSCRLVYLDVRCDCGRRTDSRSGTLDANRATTSGLKLVVSLANETARSNITKIIRRRFLPEDGGCYCHQMWSSSSSDVVLPHGHSLAVRDHIFKITNLHGHPN